MYNVNDRRVRQDNVVSIKSLSPNPGVECQQERQGPPCGDKRRAGISIELGWHPRHRDSRSTDLATEGIG